MLRNWKCPNCHETENYSSCGEVANCDNCKEPFFVPCGEEKPYPATDTLPKVQSSPVKPKKRQIDPIPMERWVQRVPNLYITLAKVSPFSFSDKAKDAMDDKFEYHGFRAPEWVENLKSTDLAQLADKYKELDMMRLEDGFMTWLMRSMSLNYEQALRVVWWCRHCDHGDTTENPIEPKKGQESGVYVLHGVDPVEFDTSVREVCAELDITYNGKKLYYGSCPDCGFVSTFEVENPDDTHNEKLLYCGEHQGTFELRNLKQEDENDI